MSGMKVSVTSENGFWEMMNDSYDYFDKPETWTEEGINQFLDGYEMSGNLYKQSAVP